MASYKGLGAGFFGLFPGYFAFILDGEGFDIGALRAGNKLILLLGVKRLCIRPRGGYIRGMTKPLSASSQYAAKATGYAPHNGISPETITL